jgi:hypothetical protein
MGEATAPTPANQPPAGAAAATNAGNSNNDYKVHQRRRGQRNRPRTTHRTRKEGNNGTHIPKEKFLGRSDDLQGYTYDVVTSKGGVAYTRTTEELARHIGEISTSVGSYIRTAIMTLKIPAQIRPVAPTGTSDGTVITVDEVDKEIFKEKIRMYVKTEAAIETHSNAIAVRPNLGSMHQIASIKTPQR